MGRMRLLKLLVIADRDCIKKTGRPILGSKVVAMNNGPLHSDVYNLIKGEHVATPEWCQYFAPEGTRVEMVRQPEVGALSRFEIELLQSVSDKYAMVDDDLLSLLTHKFEEWINYYREGTSTPIPIEAIIEAVGRGDDKEEIMNDLKADTAINNFFAKLQ